MLSQNDLRLVDEKVEGDESILTFEATPEMINLLKENYGDDYESKLQTVLTDMFTKYGDFVKSLSNDELKEIYGDEDKVMNKFNEYLNKKDRA